MYRIVIADDDEIQLEGMCCAFPWEELGIEVAAGVDDGDKALLAVKEKQADILLTDIKMTRMDGLHLTEQIRKQCPQTRVVIMSAYDDFQFAQKALRLGVDDYLLKPVDLTQMQDTMRQIVHQKNEEKRRQEAVRQSSVQEGMGGENEAVSEEIFFRNVLNGHYSRETCRRLGEPYNRYSNQKWLVLEAVPDEWEEEEEICRVLHSVSQKEGYPFLQSSGHYLICCMECELEMEKKIERFKAECRRQLKETGCSPVISFIEGTAVPELYYLGLSYEKILQIQSYSISEEKNKDFSEKDLDQYFNKNHTINKTLAEYLAKLVLMGNTEMLPEYIHKLKHNLKSAGSDSILMLSFSLSSILGELRELFFRSESDEDGQDEIYYKIIRKNTLDEAMELFETELVRLAQIARSQESVSAQQSIKKACEYIEKHFCEPALRIGEVAAEVGLSQSYFSAMFAEATGESFTEYLIKRRMKEAQMLLMNSEYKIQEIGYKTGYDNPAYFSAAFKKFTGVSVSKYKEMIKGMLQ